MRWTQGVLIRTVRTSVAPHDREATQKPPIPRICYVDAPVASSANPSPEEKPHARSEDHPWHGRRDPRRGAAARGCARCRGAAAMTGGATAAEFAALRAEL